MVCKSNWVDAILYLLKQKNIDAEVPIYFWINNKGDCQGTIMSIVDQKLDNNILTEV